MEPLITLLKNTIETKVLKRAREGYRIIGSEEGAEVPWIFDFRAIFLESELLNAYAEIFWQKYGSQYPFQVCGMESAAISLVVAIVMKGSERGTPVNGLYVRKSRKRHGLMRQVEGTCTDAPIIVVDDLINSGSTLNKEIKVLAEIGGRVSDVFVVISFRDESAYTPLEGLRSVRLQNLFSLKDFGLTLSSPQPVPDPQKAFETIWHFRAPDPSHHFVMQKSAPVIDDKRVYFGTDAGTFFALDQTTGEVEWKFQIAKHPPGKGILSSPALLGSTLYFGGYDGNVYALDAATGSKKWVWAQADWVGSSPTVAENLGLVFIGLEFGLWKKRGGIAALEINTGKLAWADQTVNFTHGSPLYIQAEQLVVIGSNDGVIYSYDAKTGERRWQYATEGDIKSRATYDAKSGLVLCGSMDGKLYMLAARDGTPIFAKETGAGIYSTPLVHERFCYIASLDKSIYAIDIDTFKDRWEYPMGGRIFASPIVAEGSLWIGSNEGRLCEVNPATGKLTSFFQVTERIVNAVAYNKETERFFVPTCANEMYCIKKGHPMQL